MQPHQCFMLSCMEKTMAKDFPWELMQTSLKNIMVFDNKFCVLHTNCHLHGNGITNYFLSSLPNRFKSPEYVALQNSVTIPLRYRHVWMEICDYKISILNRGKDWYLNEQDCRQKSILYQPDIQFSSNNSDDDDRKIILCVESICACMLTEKHDLRCSCLCHCRQCTHYLTNNTPPDFENCNCLVEKMKEIDGVTVCRAPWRRPAQTHKRYIFYLPQNNIWYCSHLNNIEESYYLYLEKFNK